MMRRFFFFESFVCTSLSTQIRGKAKKGEKRRDETRAVET